MDYTGTEHLLRLLMIEKNLSPDLRDAINEKATKFLDDLTNDVGRFLCSKRLDDEKQSEDDIRILVQCVPTALSYVDKYNRLPIHNPAYLLGGISCIPMLIEEGMKHNVGGEGMRGGLLSEDPEVGESVLKMISCIYNDNWDVCCLDVIKRLREMGFIEKEDINKYNLLGESCKESSSKRFNYFADWDPSELKVQRDGKSVLHLCASVSDEGFVHWCIGEFQLALSATLRHYPHELGLLLLKNAEGHTPFQVAREQLGEQGSWKMIKKCLDESNGGSVILERDPETNMYPFLSAAVGDDTSELDLVYYFVRRNPLTLLSEHCNDNTTTSSTDMLCSQKRKK
jgi:hypothetical protein